MTPLPEVTSPMAGFDYGVAEIIQSVQQADRHPIADPVIGAVVGGLLGAAVGRSLSKRQQRKQRRLQELKDSLGIGDVQ